MELKVNIDSNSCETIPSPETPKTKIKVTAVLLEHDIWETEICERIRNLCTQLKPLQSSIQQIVLRTTQENADSINHIIWLFPLPFVTEVV